MIAPLSCCAHDRQGMFAGHDRAAQVDRDDPVEGFFGNFGDRRIAAGDADADIVVQDVDPAPSFLGRGDDVRQFRFNRDIRLAGHAGAAFFGNHGGGFLRRRDIAVDRHDLRPFAGVQHRRRTAVADAFARALARAHDDGNLVLEPHSRSLLMRNPRDAPASKP